MTFNQPSTRHPRPSQLARSLWVILGVLAAMPSVEADVLFLDDFEADRDWQIVEELVTQCYGADIGEVAAADEYATSGNRSLRVWANKARSGHSNHVIAGYKFENPELVTGIHQAPLVGSAMRLGVRLAYTGAATINTAGSDLLLVSTLSEVLMRRKAAPLMAIVVLGHWCANHQPAEGQLHDGASPNGGLTLSGSTLFGTTGAGGANDLGTIFSINTEGTGYALLHEVAGPPTEGSIANGGLASSGSTLYGTTARGGDACPAGCGTVFSIGSDGSGFTLLHDFASGINDGAFPRGGLTFDGSTLFGTTTGGGASSRRYDLLDEH